MSDEKLNKLSLGKKKVKSKARLTTDVSNAEKELLDDSLITQEVWEFMTEDDQDDLCFD